MKRLSHLPLVAVLLFAVAFLPSVTVSRSDILSTPLATISVEPSSVSVLLGDMLTLNITVADVSDLAGWEFKLYWLKEKLNGTGVAEGPFLRQIGPTFLTVVNFTDDYNSTHGLTWVVAVLNGPGPGAFGNGTIASISLKAESVGSTSLWLSETKLVDSAANTIPHMDASGIAYITFHDVKVVSVVPSKDIVGKNYTMQVNVTVANQGNFTETFNVTAYANTTIIRSENVTLPASNSTTITFTWNATGFSYGNYTLSAYAWPVWGEEDQSDNDFEGGTVLVTIPGDADGDFKVKPQDLNALLVAYGSPSNPESPYNPNADIDDDGLIGSKDLTILLNHYGQHYP